MTTRTTDALICECGHSGSLHTAENDQPYSTPWVSHRLVGFGGEVSNWNLAKVSCPACKQTGTVKYSR